MAAPVETGSRLKKLRSLFQDCLEPGSIDAYIVFSYDSHMSLFTAEKDQRRKFISGFKGLSGTAVITKDKAYLWTDSRYHIEASRVLDENWTLMRVGIDGVPKLRKWLTTFPSGFKVGVDMHYTSHSDWEKYSQVLSETSKTLVHVKKNLIDIVWEEEGIPKLEYAMPSVYDIQFAGVTWEDKIKQIRAKMEKKKCDLLLITALDEIAWLFNMRGQDITYCPYFYSYSIITPEKTYLFTDKTRISDFVLDHLNAQQKKAGESVTLLEYDSIEEYMKEFSEKAQKIWINGRTPQFLAMYAKTDSICETSPVCILKSIKNSVELKNMKHALKKDGAVLCEIFGYIDKWLGKYVIDEFTLSSKIRDLRANMEYYIMESFESVVASGSNSEMNHYWPTSKSSKEFSRKEIILIDTGGQYLDGTTDTTRTLHFGTPSDIEKECYTMVLKAHIALATAKFPKDTNGYQLDSIAKAPLWQLGMNYEHGTGFGIGMYLQVQEGRQVISKKSVDEALLAGNVLTNKPGYYKKDSFGVRIENMVTVTDFIPKYKESPFLQFETISFIPMHQSLIEKSLLTPSEISWLNDYHAKCVDVLTPILTELKFSDGLQYLKKNAIQIK